MYITKSDYLLYKQCPKSLWLHKNNPDVFDISNSIKSLDKGNEVTEFARNLFPSGTLVEYSSDVASMVSKTHELLAMGETTIYEAAFEHEGSLVICDILHSGKSGWEIYEVKSSTGTKERHLDDMTFQYYVVSKNLIVKDIFAVHLNNNYSRKGKLNAWKLFEVVNKTEKILEGIDYISAEIEKMKELLQGDCIRCDIGSYCNKYGKDDFECGAKGHCWSHIPNYSVFDITRIGKKGFEMYEKGMVTLKDIPDDYKLSDSQKFQVKSYKENISIVDKEQIQSFMPSFSFPLYFLDFETYQQAIPLYDDVKPYQQIPFQYSLHVLETADSELIHKEFLGREGEDPRRKLAERLVADIPKDVCSVAYNMSFEKTRLKELSEQFPDLADHLMNIHDNMVDLMIPFQKKWYYTNDMKGSYSIKYVLPALLPNDESLDYSRLNIRNGSMAMETFERLHTYNPEEIEAIRKDLLAYCKLDTLAMVKVWEVLNNL